MPQGRQNAQHPGFVARDAPYDCGACIAWHAHERGFPTLEPRDYPAWNLYLQLQGQQRIGMDVIGLDYGVLETMYRLMNVPRWCWRWMTEQLLVLDHATQANRVVQREREQRKVDHAKGRIR